MSERTAENKIELNNNKMAKIKLTTEEGICETTTTATTTQITTISKIWIFSYLQRVLGVVSEKVGKDINLNHDIFNLTLESTRMVQHITASTQMRII